MSTTYNRRCGLCGQYVIADRETLLEQDRLQWDEATVDDFIAGAAHTCWETEAFGPDTAFSRQWNRLADEGLMRVQLDWLIAGELERRQAAGPAGWAVFTSPAASSTTTTTTTTTLGTGMVEGLVMLGSLRRVRAYRSGASPCPTAWADVSLRGP